MYVTSIFFIIIIYLNGRIVNLISFLHHTGVLLGFCLLN